MRQFYHNIQLKLKELELRVSMPLSIGIFILQQLKKQMKNSNGPSRNLNKTVDHGNTSELGMIGAYPHESRNPSIYHIYGHGDLQHASSLFRINCDKVDMLDEDLEDDDMDLYYRLSVED